MVWLVRQPFAALIRGDAPRRGTVRGWLADLWPIIATMYFVALFAASMHGILIGAPGPLGIGFESVLVVVIVPIIDLALCRALAAAVAARQQESTGAEPHWLAAYEPIFRRAIHIVTIVCGMLVFARLWGLKLFAYANSFGGDIASSLLGIGIVLLATYLAWQVATVAIDRRLRAEGEAPSDVPASRLRTVLPILRATMLVTIAVMATMSILAALGVNILPLLAGASIVGVAIGFGSQTLVKDIVSGAFFLMDDAFRLGEYIEVGDAKGRVEKINVRSVFLRHHRGALNVAALRRHPPAAQHQPRLGGARDGVQADVRHQHAAGEEDPEADRRGPACRSGLCPRHPAAAQVRGRHGRGGQRDRGAREVHCAPDQQCLGRAQDDLRPDHPRLPGGRHHVRASPGDGKSAAGARR